MVFDFRGKDVKPQVAVMPSPVKTSFRDEADGLDDSFEPSGRLDGVHLKMGCLYHPIPETVSISLIVRSFKESPLSERMSSSREAL